VSYASIASDVTSANSSYISYVSSNFKTDSLSSIWSGGAATTLLNDVKTVLDNVTENSNNVSSFTTALNKLDEYKQKKELLDSDNEKMESYRTQLRNTPNDEYNRTTIERLNSNISSLQTEITNLTTEKSNLKKTIVDALNSITSISSTIQAVSSVDVSGDLDGYVVNLYDLLSDFQSGKLSNMNGSLYNYYSQEEVQSTLDKVQQQYSGRDAAVNSALSVMSLASQKGVKLDYVWGGGHHSGSATINDVAQGTDCSGFVSWAVDQGTSSSFQSMTTSGLINQGQQVNYENAKRGDILVSGGHAILIVDNDANSKNFLVAEASTPSVGVVLRTRSYSSIYGEYQARDLSSLYGN